VESAEHDRLQLPVQRIEQVEPSLQLTLPLSPTVISQVEPPEQSRLHDAPHDPEHSLSSVHASVQLSPSHEVPSVLHAAPGSQAHEVPLHVGAAVSPPQATRVRAETAIEARTKRIPAGDAARVPGATPVIPATWPNRWPPPYEPCTRGVRWARVLRCAR